MEMNRSAPGFPCDGHPVGERQEGIVVAGQFDGNAACPAQLASDLPRDIERDFLLQRTAHADGARIMAAMAGVDHDKATLRRLAGSRSGLRGGASLGRGIGSGPASGTDASPNDPRPSDPRPSRGAFSAN